MRNSLKDIKLALKLAFVVPMVMAFAMSATAYAQVSQQEINNNLCSGANIDFTGDSGGSCQSTSATDSISNIVHNIINVLSLIVGVVAVIMIIIGGLRYITSGGNDTSVTGAKNTILYAIIGLVIVALAQVMVHFVLSKVTTQ